MKNSKRFLGIILAGTMLLSSQVSFTNQTNNTNVDLSNLQKEAITSNNKIIAKKVSENEPSPLNSAEAFSIENFGGNRSLEKTLVLNDTMGYWKIWIINTESTDIKVGITTQSGVTTVPAGETWLIYSGGKWNSGNYTVTFISGAGMYGNAHARVADTESQLD